MYQSSSGAVEAFSRFCGSPFWDEFLTVNTTSPDLTVCFEKTVLVWLPCAFLWCFTAPSILLLHFSSKDSPPLQHSWLTNCKQLFSSLLFLVAMADFAHSIYQWQHDGLYIANVDFVMPGLLAASMVLHMVVTEQERLRGIRSSGVPFIFFMLLAIQALAALQTTIRNVIREGVSDDLYRLTTSCIYSGIVFLQFILHFFANPAQTCMPVADGPNPCPEYKLGFITRLFFWWYMRLGITGWKRALEFSDVWDLNPEDTCEKVMPLFESHWQQEVMKVRRSKAVAKADEAVGIPPKEPYEPSIALTIAKCFGSTYAWASGIKLLNDILLFAGPQILKWLIAFISSDDFPFWQGYFYAVLLFVVSMVRTLLMQQFVNEALRVGMRVRTAVTGIVYKKALTMSSASRRISTVGETVNLMSVDAQRLMDLASYLVYLWSAPFIIVLCMYFLWQELGPSVLAGVAVLILLLPLNAVIAHLTNKLQVSQMTFKDLRINVMNEILNGIKVLKLYAWEPFFQDKILDLREKELHVLKKSNYLGAVSIFTWTCAPFLVSLVSFMVYVLSDPSHVLTASKAFVSLALFNLIRFPLSVMPWTITLLVQSSVSLRRLRRYLMQADLDPNSVDHNSAEAAHIVVTDGNFKWDEISDAPTLANINLQLKEGTLTAIVGQVGAGKSSLMSAFLGEMERMMGKVHMRGKLAYVSQQAWIQNVTLRDNIVFNNDWDETWYHKVIDACALEPDLDVLPGGDLTEIGERGINLSGGQKQRVSVARAVYSDADIFLLDDPLSAVDAHVGKHMFGRVISASGLLNNKTRVLVTHGVSFLPEVDSIVVIRGGRISEVGSFEQLLSCNGAFAEFLRNYLTNPENEDVITDSEDPDIVEEILQKVAPGYDRQASRPESSMDEDHLIPESALRQQSGNIQVNGKANVKLLPSVGDKLIDEEKAETGNVSLAVFKMYFKAVSTPIVSIIFLSYLLANAAQVGSSIWLSAWSTDQPLDDGSQDIPLRNMRLAVYAALGTLQSLFVLSSAIGIALGVMFASRSLHRDMLRNMFRSPMSFFDTTPLGRIVNRFSKDIDVVDNIIPMSLQNWLFCVFYVFGTLFLISYGTPIFAAAIPPLAVLYWFIQRIYVASSRQLKRLESISRSPIYSHFSETVTGASTIRAFQVQERFILDNEARIDNNQKCYFAIIMGNRWLAVHLEAIGNLIIFFSALFTVIGKQMGEIDPGLAGLSISNSLGLIQALNWAVRFTSELETNIVAVERVKEYSETPNEVGIVGRTGAGKSSLILSLFRIIEASEGAIHIDGRNIAEMGLHELRSKLTVIPQDPMLFSGSLRMNLDPFSWHSDGAVWRAIEHAHLKAFVMSLPAGLQYEISEGGENLSVGQRQLVCLARALLRKTKVLILDEATAAIDLETDDLIQATIRQAFANCTVLTVAHRLNTIMDSTRVMVLDNGMLKEFDTPENLLQDKNSIFYSMAREAGIVGRSHSLLPDTENIAT
ncbi:PREDICTED: multidrug resistance-associated protein 1-like isoform X2 [Priapulus caudatus]|uniref:ABC-type glutathione-S-conjugate transporter n=1 Tax=Priapulus caudatus TaxID=37621 RepID=A0ABM1FA67_PRICU|nr:PREDICTED: multidrug resistance-associated protein 1-like isoform X2 [Priapulus caudatus]